MIPVFGWSALLGLPALGYRVHGRDGFLIGAGSAALIILAPELINIEWNEPAHGWGFVSGTGYIFLVSLIALVFAPISLLMGLKDTGELGQLQVLGRVAAFILSIVTACVVQAVAARWVSARSFSCLVAFQIAALGGFWSSMSQFARLTVTDGEGYDGLFEAIAYDGSIFVCTVFAFCLIAVSKKQRVKLSV